MIFVSVNERGEKAVDLILKGRKTVTRRLKPLPVGKEFAIQPGRGKFAVGRARVKSCMPHSEWLSSVPVLFRLSEHEQEARKEGFVFWKNLNKWLEDHTPEGAELHRIEFELVDR